MLGRSRQTTLIIVAIAAVLLVSGGATLLLLTKGPPPKLPAPPPIPKPQLPKLPEQQSPKLPQIEPRKTPEPLPIEVAEIEPEPEPAPEPTPPPPTPPEPLPIEITEAEPAPDPEPEPTPPPPAPPEPETEPEPEPESPPPPSPRAPESPRSRADAAPDDISSLLPPVEQTPEPEPTPEPELTPSEEPAADDAPPQPEEDHETPRSRAAPAPDEITEVIRQEEKPQRGIIPHGPLVVLEDAWGKFNSELDSRTKLRLGTAYTVLFQQATGGQGRRTAASGDYDIFGRWQPLDQDPGWYGTLSFALEYRHQIGSISPNELGREIGSLWNTTRAFGEAPFALKEVWWRQRLFDDLFQVTVGKTNAKHMTNTNRLSSQNFFFLNSAFSDNPARVFPQNGLGVNVRFQPNKDWYVDADIRAADARRTRISINNLSGYVAVAAELGITPEIPNLGVGHYRFTFWHNPDSDILEEQAGFAISFDQEIGRVIPFLRYSINDGDGLEDNEHPVRQILSVGVGVGSPPTRPNDYWGVAAAWGQPEDSSLRDQWAFEAFYRFQLTPAQQLTLGAQMLVHPSNAPDDDVLGIFEVRWRVAF